MDSDMMDSVNLYYVTLCAAGACIAYYLFKSDDAEVPSFEFKTISTKTPVSAQGTLISFYVMFFDGVNLGPEIILKNRLGTGPTRPDYFKSMNNRKRWAMILSQE